MSKRSSFWLPEITVPACIEILPSFNTSLNQNLDFIQIGNLTERALHCLKDTNKPILAHLWYNHIKCSDCLSVIIQACIKGLNLFWIIVYYYRLLVEILHQITVKARKKGKHLLHVEVSFPTFQTFSCPIIKKLVYLRCSEARAAPHSSFVSNFLSVTWERNDQKYFKGKNCSR